MRRLSGRRGGPAFMLVGALLALAACGGGAVATDPRAQLQSRLSGTLVDPAISRPLEVLRDTSGKAFPLVDRPSGELTVLFFGYTHCPDFCPTTAADLAAARALLPVDLRRHVQVVFVTEDPHRDTAPVLTRWLQRFDASDVGLIGGNAASARMLEDLRSTQTAFNQELRAGANHRHSPSSPHPDSTDSEEVGHTSVIYAFAPSGRSIIWTQPPSPRDLARDFTTLLASPGPT